MTTTEDDRREFVVARWPELEALARVVTDDADTARRVTTDVLAALSSRWGAALEDGRPGEQARSALLVAALAAAERRPRPDAVTDPRVGLDADADAADAAEDDEDDPDDRSVRALAAAVRDLDPLGRALVAARACWDADADEVAHLLARPVAEVRAHGDEVSRGLAQVHDGARADAGLDPAPWLLDHDLDAAVVLLLGRPDDPPDPAALVADRASGLQRRRLLLGGVAAAGLAGAGWWVASGVGETSPTPRPTGLAADDPAWDTTRRWPARGRFAADPDVQALVIRDAPSGSRLLYADVVGDRTVVVASPADISGRPGVRVVVWTGPQGAPLASLRTVPLARDALSGVRDVVALVVAQDVGDALLVLAPPALREAHYAPVVTPVPAGGSVRSFTPLPLTAGVGVELVGRGLGPATLVSAGGYQGVPAGTPEARHLVLPLAPSAVFASSRRDLVAELTGIPGGLLSARVVVESRTTSGVLDPDVGGQGNGTGRVVVVHTRTPDDAIVRSVRVGDAGRGRFGAFDAEEASVVASAEADGPVFITLPTTSRTQRFLVVAPGAARARLFSATSPELAVTRRVRCIDGTAVLTVPDSRQEGRYRLLLEDAAGARLFLGLPPASSALV